MKKNLVALAIFTLVVLGGFVGYFLRGNNQSSSTQSQSTGQITTNGKVADYSGKDLTTFPKEVLSDRSITVLILANNNLTGALPAEIHDLVNLEQLDASNNLMTGIPAEIGQLKHLKILNYANNKITGLPNELGNLTQLEVLDLRGNNVSQQDLAQIRAKLTSTQIKL